MSIPVETLAVEIAELESFDVVEDNLYQIIIRVGDSSNEYTIKEFVFKNYGKWHIKISKDEFRESVIST